MVTTLFKLLCKCEIRFFLKENVWYLLWTYRDPISLILGTQFSPILEAQ